jgi:hypothetical protein
METAAINKARKGEVEHQATAILDEETTIKRHHQCFREKNKQTKQK